VSRETARRVLETEAQAVRDLIGRLDESLDRAVEILASCRGRVVVTGMGKSGIICRKIAATLASTGTPSLFLHPADAVHGDLGVLTAEDAVIALSYSGETEEILRLLETLKRLGVRLIALVGNRESELARHADAVLDVGVREEACPLRLAPTASTTAALAMGDALAMALLERKGFTAEQFAARHPGGQLGKKVLAVRHLMHTGEEVPRARPETPLADAVREMSRKGFGITTVVDGEGRLLGVITDGDLRRAFETAGAALEGKRAGEVATREPRTIGPDALAVEAYRMMERWKITCLPVTDAERRVAGVIHLHDLWRTQMF
jgi:arabinose-5-phosphate isomerase